MFNLKHVDWYKINNITQKCTFPYDEIDEKKVIANKYEFKNPPHHIYTCEHIIKTHINDPPVIHNKIITMNLDNKEKFDKHTRKIIMDLESTKFSIPPNLNITQHKKAVKI